MSNLTQRNIQILKIIIEEYIKTGDVLGSKLLLKKYDLWVSSATVRNDMAALETLELLYQPYNSAGRLPTAKWLRAFVNYMMEQTPEYFLEQNNSQFHTKTLREFADFVHNVVYNLARNTTSLSKYLYLRRKYTSIPQGLYNNSQTNRNRWICLICLNYMRT